MLSYSRAVNEEGPTAGKCARPSPRDRMTRALHSFLRVTDGWPDGRVSRRRASWRERGDEGGVDA